MQDWSGQCCIIVASGPSARDVHLEPYRGVSKFIVVNESWRLAPWADAILVADGMWWYKNKGLPKFRGMKFTLDSGAQSHFRINLLRFNKNHPRLVFGNPGIVGMGGNSGFYALNLALMFHCTRIALVGFDMTLKHGIHWHGEHPKGMSNPQKARVEKWRNALDEEAAGLKSLGVSVINTSAASALKNFQKLSLPEAMAVFMKEGSVACPFQTSQNLQSCL